MNKKRVLLVTVLVGIIGILAAGYALLHFLQKKVVYIAVAGPFSGEYKQEGENMLQGIRLYLDKVKQTGELPDMRIELLLEDDQDESAGAERAAEKIAQDNKALVVLGHSYSSTSVAAGKIYRKYEIPAITASATAENVTLNNPWYFRVIPNNAFQAILPASTRRAVLL